ncbi:ribonuclease H-like domain-containing protein [Tanacetum coccineum]
MSPTTNTHDTPTDIPTQENNLHTPQPTDGPTSPSPTARPSHDTLAQQVHQPDPLTHLIQTLGHDTPIPQTGLTATAPVTNPNLILVHPMVTRFRVGSNRHPERLNIHVSSIYPLPNSYVDAFNNPNWQNAMNDEYIALIENNTWTLAPRHAEANIVRCFDVDDIFSPIVKPGTIRTNLSLLKMSLYGLKQALWAWFQRFSAYITRVEFTHSRCDSSFFIYRQRADTAYLLLYVDDIVLTASSELLLQQIIDSLHQEFSMTDLNSLNYFFVQQVCLYMHDPHEPYFSALKWILRYVRGTLDHGLQLFSSSTTSLVVFRMRIGLVALLLREAVYCGVANAVAETCWLRNVLRELHTPLSFATLVYCDNVSVVYLSGSTSTVLFPFECRCRVRSQLRGWGEVARVFGDVG